MRLIRPALAVLFAALACAPSAQAVVGGRDATVLDDPSMVGLVTHGEPADEALFCGGALIAPQVVVTAMHCLDGPRQQPGTIDVVGGSLSRTDPNLGRVQVAQLIRNPLWDEARTLHDVLVMKLAAPLPLPALTLAGPSDAALSSPGSVLRATGWGLTNFKDDSSQPIRLKAADIPVVDDAICADLFGTSIYNGTFQICGQSATGKPDTCQGDSGGPLVGGASDALRLVGVVSFGPSSCGQRGAAGVYADVASERGWVLAAAGLPDADPSTTPVTPTPAPAVTKPKTTVVLRFGSISCSDVTCRVNIKASGTGNPQIKDVILRVDRKAQGQFAPAKRFARARKTGVGRFTAKTLLPYGTLTITAVAYDASGVQLSKTVRETLEVD